jgi:hypothetical protein
MPALKPMTLLLLIRWRAQTTRAYLAASPFDVLSHEPSRESALLFGESFLRASFNAAIEFN